MDHQEEWTFQCEKAKFEIAESQDCASFLQYSIARTLFSPRMKKYCESMKTFERRINLHVEHSNSAEANLFLTTVMKENRYLNGNKPFFFQPNFLAHR